MLEPNQLRENLEKLERSVFLSISDSTKKESFYREFAVSSNISISNVKEEVLFNDLKIGNFVYSKDRSFSEKNKITREELQLELKYWETLNAIVSTTVPLISSEIIEPLKQYVQLFIKWFNQSNDYNLFKNYFYYLIKKNSSKLQQATLEYYFLLEQILLNCYQIYNYIDNKQDLNQYIWHNYTDEEKIELMRQFIMLFGEDLKQDIELKQNYKNIIEFLEQLPSNQQAQDSIFNNQEDQEIQSTNSNDQSISLQQDNWEREEQIKKNQKAIKYFKKQIKEINRMTEEQRKDGEEFEKLFLNLIEKNRF